MSFRKIDKFGYVW